MADRESGDGKSESGVKEQGFHDLILSRPARGSLFSGLQSCYFFAEAGKALIAWRNHPCMSCRLSMT
jgi:hypothetical protein